MKRLTDMNYETFNFLADLLTVVGLIAVAWLIGNVGQRWLQQRIQQQGFSPATYDLVRYGHGAEFVFGARVAFVFGIAVLAVPELLAACADFGLPPEIRQEVSVVPNRRSKGLDILAAVACKRNRSGLGDQDWDEFQLYGSTPGPYPPKEDGSCRELDMETSSWNGVKAFPTFFLTQGSPYAAVIPRTTIASIMTTTPNSFAKEEEEEEWYCGVPGHGVNPISRFLGWNSGIKIASGSIQRRYDTSRLRLPLYLSAAWSDTEEPLATVGSVGSCRTFEQNIACIPSSGDEEGNSPTAREIIIARAKMCNNSAEETEDDIGAPLVRLYSMATIVSINDGVSKLLMNGTLAEPRVPDLPYPLAVESFTRANIRMSLDAVNASRGKSHTVVRVQGISPMGFWIKPNWKLSASPVRPRRLSTRLGGDSMIKMICCGQSMPLGLKWHRNMVFPILTFSKSLTWPAGCMLKLLGLF